MYGSGVQIGTIMIISRLLMLITLKDLNMALRKLSEVVRGLVMMFSVMFLDAINSNQTIGTPTLVFVVSKIFKPGIQ
jgi:hypothetical protein